MKENDISSYQNLLEAGKEKINEWEEDLPNNISDYVQVLRERLDPKFSKFLLENQEYLENLIHLEEQHFPIDFFSASTLERGYLLKTEFNGPPKERIKFMFLRVSCFIHMPNLEKIKKTFLELLRGEYIHASPTILNAGTQYPQMASCFLLRVDDSLESIYDKLKESAIISKHHGGIGIDFSSLRHSEIRKIGYSRGIVPIAKLWNETMRLVDQLGTRKGAATIFLNPFHIDTMEFLELPLKTGPSDMRAIDLTYALFIPDLLYKRAKEKRQWTMFCPSKVPKLLLQKRPEDFERVYLEYESNESIPRKQVDAQSLFYKIASIQRQTGMPFILNRDTINRANMQENIGPVTNSNLCVEIVEVCDSNNTASCNLASINLSNKILITSEGKKEIDYERIGQSAESLVENLNNIIDRNLYPLQNIETHNKKSRPLGIGVSGLSDLLQQLSIPYQESKYVNKKIFSCIYYHSLKKSNELAMKNGLSYAYFENSPLSKGIFHFERDPYNLSTSSVPYGSKKNWEKLRENIINHGVMNSLFVALMPTASTAQLLGNTESFEPCTANVYVRRVMNGRYFVINKYLEKVLSEKGLWSDVLAKEIARRKGSIQWIENLDEQTKNVFKTAYEIDPKVLIDLASSRQPFVDQSQSFNWFIEDPSDKDLVKYMFLAWKSGLKTSMYYLHSQPATLAQGFGTSCSSSSSSICSSCSL